MDSFLNDKENTHDSSIMNYIRKIMEYSKKQYKIVNISEYYKTIYELLDKNAEKYNTVISTIDYISTSYKSEITAIIGFAISKSSDLAKDIVEELYKLAKFDRDNNTLRCTTGYINNIAIIIPVYFPNLFEVSITPIPVIMEEIDAIIDKAIDMDMSSDNFSNELMFYVKKYGFSPAVKNKCYNLINFYSSEHY